MSNLRLSADAAAGVISRLSEGILVLDSEGGVLFGNPAVCRILSLTPAQVDGRPVTELFDTASELAALVRRALAGEAAADEDIRHTTAPGADLSWLRCTTLFLKGGEQPSILLTVREISDLKRAEREMWQV